MNTLMKKYKENQIEKEEHFKARRDQLIAEASAAGQRNASSNISNNDDEVHINADVSSINIVQE